MNNKLLGISLIELLVSLAIISSLMTIAIPSYADFIIRQRVNSEIFRLSKLLQIARNYAIHYRLPVTVCPLNDQNNCTAMWSEPLTVFTDNNNNKQFEPELNELPLFSKPEVFDGDKIHYAKHRIAVTYGSSGHLTGWGQNGTFKYCPKDHFDKARGIVVATSGRIYQTFQSKSGQDQTRSYQYIECN